MNWDVDFNANLWCEAGQGASFSNPKCFSIDDGIRHPRFSPSPVFWRLRREAQPDICSSLFLPSCIIEVTRARIQEFATPFVKFRSQPFVVVFDECVTRVLVAWKTANSYALRRKTSMF